MNNNDVFIDLYNRLDNLLRDYYHIDDRSYSVIKRYEDELKRSTSYKTREKGYCLETIREVRNSLIHESKIHNVDAFVVNDVVISYLKNEIEIIMNPKYVTSIMRSINNVTVGKLDSGIDEIIKRMSKNYFSHTPIMDNYGRLIGVFSESTVYSKLIKSKHITIEENSKVKDFIDFIGIDSHESERYAFISQKTKLNDILDVFEKKTSHEKRLVMIFVTESGKATEKVLGIITPQDVINSL